MHFLDIAVILLAAGVIAVPLAGRAGLGAVLGYLLAGVAIGPSALGIIKDVEGVLHLSELGVVMLLFIIGLELNPQRLWTMRKMVFGLGLAQVLLTGLVLGTVIYLLGLGMGTSLLLGLALALSSTAMVIQILAERKELATKWGRSGFAILLFQDLAAIPLIALVPVFGAAAMAMSADTAVEGAKILGILAMVIAGGHYGLRPVLRLLAKVPAAEVFTAASLLLVLGIALLMEHLGLSMAMGGFLAGVLLADSEYRHELEASVQPFKGLLLGLFFMAVGMALDLGQLVREPALVFGLVAGLMLIKAIMLISLGKATGLGWGPAVRLAITLCQGGEFAFVVLTIASTEAIMPPELVALASLVVTLSMALTPLLIKAGDLSFGMIIKTVPADPTYDMPPKAHKAVLLAGFGRFGQVTGRILKSLDIPFVALDKSPDHIEVVRRFGNKVYFGDAARLDLLRAAEAGEAAAMVIAVDDEKACMAIVETMQKHFPHVPLYARAHNRKHAHMLMDAGVPHITREVFYGGLHLTEALLRGLGLHASDARRTVSAFEAFDEVLLREQWEYHHDMDHMAERAIARSNELAEVMRQDALRHDAQLGLPEDGGPPPMPALKGPQET